MDTNLSLKTTCIVALFGMFLFSNQALAQKGLRDSICSQCGSNLRDQDHQTWCPYSAAGSAATSTAASAVSSEDLGMGIAMTLDAAGQAIGALIDLFKSDPVESGIKDDMKSFKNASSRANAARKAYVKSFEAVQNALSLKSGATAGFPAPVTMGLINAISEFHAQVHAAVGAKVIQQISIDRHAGVSGVSRTSEGVSYGGKQYNFTPPESMPLKHIPIPETIPRRTRDLAGSDGAFSTCARCGNYQSQCTCARSGG